MSKEIRPTRSLGFGSGAAVVVASMIGVGVFTTSGFALADLGTRPRVLAAWCVGGVLATCGALSYGALAKRFPESGGEYHFLARILHPMAGFLAGWVSLLAGFAAPTAAAALGLQAYLAPSFGTLREAHWIATAAILITSLQHGFGVTAGVRIQNTIVGVKLLGLLGFLGYGAWVLGTRGAMPIEPTSTVAAGLDSVLATTADAFPYGAFAVSLVWISFSFSGWNAVVYIAGEIRDPQRNLQRSLLGGCLFVTALYLALNALFLYAAPVEAITGQVDIAAVAAEHLGGSGFQLLVRLLIGLALLTSISAMTMIGPRVYARMAEDGLFPRFFRPRNGNFRHAILLQGALALGVVWSSRLSDLLGYIGFTLGLSAAATVFALMWQRRREGADRLQLPGYPYVPLVFLIGVLGSSGFLVWRSSTEALWGVLTVASGLPIYFLMRRSQENAK